MKCDRVILSYTDVLEVKSGNWLIGVLMYGTNSMLDNKHIKVNEKTCISGTRETVTQDFCYFEQYISGCGKGVRK
jgi:hypothetical protein